MAADQIRLGNADLMIAGGTESMSMVPMMGNKIAMARRVRQRPRGHRLRHGHHRREGRRGVEGLARRPGRVRRRVAPEGVGRDRPASSSDEISAYEVISRQPDLAGNAVRLKKRWSNTTKARARTPRWRGWPSCARCSATQFGGTVTAGNSSQMSDGAAGVLLASEQAIKDYGLTPLARFVSFSVAGVRPK
jgi:acetyl-CoA acyltransferase